MRKIIPIIVINIKFYLKILIPFLFDNLLITLIIFYIYYLPHLF